MRILILEDDPLIALDLHMIVADEGHEVVGPCASVAEAQRWAGSGIDLALLDIDLPDGKSFDLATRLLTHGVPFAFVSASMKSEVPPHLRQVAFIAKPYQHAAIRNSLTRTRALAI